MPFTLQLPNPFSKEGIDPVEVEVDRNVIIVGANGSGKTRLGTWIDLESPMRQKSHRISAHKNLSMPDQVGTMPLQKAQFQLLYGQAEAPVGEAHQWKAGNRFGGYPATQLLGDFGWLLCYLFSEYTQASVDYRQASQADTSGKKIEVNLTALDKIERLWGEVLPHRKLTLKNQQVNVSADSGGAQYSGVHMSDGERVIFYLIGQSLAVPAGHIIIIDEPELHLHKSIQVPLWSAIESLRPDCLFVYLTHDVDFAASMAASSKIWLKQYNGARWDWEFIQDQDSISEAMLLELLGSRKRALVVEGVKGGKDSTLYQLLFPEYLIIPVGSCSKVIEVVKSLNGADASQLHRLNVTGLVDRDRRTVEEIDSLRQSNIYVLSVAEVESLFCVEEIIKLVSLQLARDPETDFASVVDHVFNRFASELEAQISLRVVSEVKFKLNLFNEKAKGPAGIAEELTRLAGSIDAVSIYDDVENSFKEIISRRDYGALLSFYNRKYLADTVAGELGLAKGQLFDLVLRLAKTDKIEAVRHALLPYFGNFSPMRQGL